MPGERGLSLPIAALSVVALFLSTTFLGPHAFDLLRQGGGEGDKRAQFADPPVESRLWEDPFAALARYRAKLKEICAPAPEAGPGGRRIVDPRCVRGELTAAKFKELFTPAPGEEVTLLAAMLPGAAFIGVEEARRRVRYAVLAGLDAEGFAPEDSEHMGLLSVRPCDEMSCGPRTDAQSWSAESSPPPKASILYETFV